MRRLHNVTRRALVAGAVAAGLVAGPESERAIARSHNRKHKRKRRKPAHNPNVGGPLRPPEVFAAVRLTGFGTFFVDNQHTAVPVYSATFTGSWVQPGGPRHGELTDTKEFVAGSSLEEIRRREVDNIRELVVDALLEFGVEVARDDISVTVA